MNRTILIIATSILLVASVMLLLNKARPQNAVEPSSVTQRAPVLSADIAFLPPLSNARARITKKPFGIQVSPKNSPVSPEKFTGYHTGVDFETTPEEKDSDVVVRAICQGPLIVVRTATGYGGVVVQRCETQDVTVVYGHLKLSSVSKVGTVLKVGDTLGVLGKGYSLETSGERKHLHLGIHQGAVINIKGYVQKPEELREWIDSKEFLKK